MPLVSTWWPNKLSAFARAMVKVGDMQVAGKLLTVDTPYLTSEPDVDDPT
jgi:hypothetical protein